MWRIFGGACVALTLALTAYAAGDASDVGIGVNYNWWKFTLTSVAVCRAQDQPRTAPLWILPSYDRASVRHTVREQLKSMRRAGFTALRIIVFYGHDTRPDPSAFSSLTGDLDAADRTKLTTFVGDIARAGYRSLEVVPDFRAENALFCRNRQWGDCFDVRRTGENWRFVAQVTQTAVSAAGRMRVRVDIANEKAPDPAMPQATLQRAKTYLQTIAGRFQRRFGRRWLVSVARSVHSDPSETSNRLNLLIADLAEVRLVPKYLELHEYSDDPQDVQASLDAIESLAERIGAAVVLGELRYHSDAQAAAIAAWVTQHPKSRLRELAQWPEYDPSRNCEINPAPPYTPGALGAIP